MADNLQAAADSFQSFVGILRRKPSSQIILSRCGQAVRELSGCFAAYPVVAEDLANLGDAIGDLQHRFSPIGEAL